MDALACGTTVLASETAPVREMIEHEQNGLLVDFFDIDGMVEAADAVLCEPSDYRHLGQAGLEMIRSRYTLDVCLPAMLQLYEDVCR
jgi:glycosyltransferase involved in cell wall biosynthesis